ncbi:Peroxisomal membrane protein PMP34 [Trachymyrmex cornetzi]|uniref:Peroxisomal membrane protein PMP34 n=1 Tax=Trachymyrmex cornetzi TaxID=471704 RepID=A0A195EFW0_9HYME|nr:Peroxisomal membrane protein PMP34 [Trachymyrmex cornetzi]
MSGNGQNRNIFTYDTLVHAISGAVGSVVAMAAFYPLDTVRSRLQLEEGRQSKNTLAVIRELIAKEGPYTLYRGIVPVLQSLCASNFVYFYTFHGLKELRSKRNQTAGSDLLLASIAGVINVLITTPLWVVNTRLKMRGVGLTLERNNNEYATLYGCFFLMSLRFTDGLVHIWKYEGLRQLWAGTLPSLVLVTNPAIQFMTYESIKRRVLASFGDVQPPAWIFFIIGAIAKAVATVMTYPLQLVQTKLRHGYKYPNLPPDAGTLQILFYILNSRKSQHRFRSQFRYKLNNLVSPLLQTRKENTGQQDEDSKYVNVTACCEHSRKIDRKRSEAILKFLTKLKIVKSSKSQVQYYDCKSAASNISHAGDTMNPSLRRNTCENVINKEPIGSTIAAKSKLEPKSPVIAYDYEAAISQPDIPICSNIDNNTLNPSWSEQSDELSAPTKKRNFYVRGKTGLTTKKKGIVFKSKIQAKKVTHIKKELIPSSKIIRNVENYIQKNNDDGVTPNCHMPLNQVCFHIISLF